MPSHRKSPSTYTLPPPSQSATACAALLLQLTDCVLDDRVFTRTHTQARALNNTALRDASTLYPMLRTRRGCCLRSCQSTEPSARFSRGTFGKSCRASCRSPLRAQTIRLLARGKLRYGSQPRSQASCCLRSTVSLLLCAVGTTWRRCFYSRSTHSSFDLPDIPGGPVSHSPASQRGTDLPSGHVQSIPHRHPL